MGSGQVGCGVSGLIVNPFAGPGGWESGMRMLGLGPVLGIELDRSACATNAAAGGTVVQGDVTAFPVERLAGKVAGFTGSPECTTFSAAGNGAGNAVTDILAAGIRDMFAGRKTRALRRREMAHALRVSRWLADTPARQMDVRTWRKKRQQAWKRQLLARAKSRCLRQRALAYAAPGPHLTREQRSARIREATLSASLVLEPARFLAAGMPEWAALEQVPEVLPLWKVYAEELRKLGYSVWCGTLNSADYGVPQTRIRAILIASRVRTVRRPAPTHYDPRKGMLLWGAPWVSMAVGLGWGPTGRPGPAVTAGGTATGGAEPFPTRARELLQRARDAGEWKFRNNNNNNNACERSLGESAGTLFFSKRSNWAAWVHDRPATTVQGDPRIGRPGHKDRERGGESQFAQDSVRITVQEAAVLQSFRPDYPWQGSKTAQFRQVGDAVPPRLAMAVCGEATGIAWQELAARFYGESEAAA